VRTSKARVTDHRINFTTGSLPAVPEGEIGELAAVGATTENGAS